MLWVKIITVAIGCIVTQAHYVREQAALTEIKYSGKGFTSRLQEEFLEALNDAYIFYKNDYFAQTSYIEGKLALLKSGAWNIVIVKNVNITKIAEVSVDLQYSVDEDTWALWYGSCSFNPLALHLAIYRKDTNRSISNVSTSKSEKGSNLSDKTAEVIKSIVQTLDNTKDIAKYIQKFDGQNWSVLSIRTELNGYKPETYSTLSADGTYITFAENVTLGGHSYKQIIYV